MDSDELKKAWQKNTILKEKLPINDNQIREMLQKEGQTALGKLIRYAIFYVIASIPLGFFMCLCSYRFFEAGGFYVIVPLTFLALCVFLIFPSEIYLLRLLKSIDFSTMSLKEVSTKILKYQQIIQRWERIGIMSFILFLGVWMFFFYKLTFGDKIIWGFIIYMIVLFFIGLAAIPYLYKKMYYKNINKVKAGIRELEEFEED